MGVLLDAPGRGREDSSLPGRVCHCTDLLAKMALSVEGIVFLFGGRDLLATNVGGGHQ